MGSYHGASMVPLADMFNHRTDGEHVHLEIEEGQDQAEHDENNETDDEDDESEEDQSEEEEEEEEVPREQNHFMSSPS